MLRPKASCCVQLHHVRRPVAGGCEHHLVPRECVGALSHHCEQRFKLPEEPELPFSTGKLHRFPQEEQGDA